MKYIRKFENIEFPTDGDYIFFINKNNGNGSLLRFLENNIGIIKYTYPSYYEIKYKNIPSNIEAYFYNEKISLSKETVRFATPDEIEHYEILNKYNI
jgi:hypothetical protein